MKQRFQFYFRIEISTWIISPKPDIGSEESVCYGRIKKSSKICGGNINANNGMKVKTIAIEAGNSLLTLLNQKLKKEKEPLFISANIIEDIKKPLITKNISTPTNPPDIKGMLE